MSDEAMPAEAAERLRARRAELVALLEELPETRLSKLTKRHGWTVRHEVCWLAGADAELRTRLGGGNEGAGRWGEGSRSNADEVRWRRVRGEAMHAAQELRLGALREHLAQSGDATADLLAAADAGANPGVREVVAAIEARTDEALEAIQEILGR